MTTFLNGPALGQRLSLSRSPFFLRVVEKGGKFDALDQLTDEPAKDEAIHVYVRAAYHGNMHVNYGGGKGGWYAIAEYSLFAIQPDDAEVRDTTRWREWTQRIGTMQCRTRRRQ